MTNPASTPDLLDWQLLADTAIELFPDQIDRALALSQSAPHPDQQWQIYLQALALFGFEQWLAGWATDLEVKADRCPLFQPQYAGLPGAVCNLQVGGVNCYVLPVNSLADTGVELPRAAIDLPQFVPHLYVLVEVLEELMEAHVYGYLRHDQLVEQLQAHPQTYSLPSQEDCIYCLPLDWFTLDSSTLLLELRRLAALSSQKAANEKFNENLAAGDRFASGYAAPSLPALYTPPGSLSQQVINTGLWLQGQLGAVAQELSWMLLPTFATGSALRSTTADLQHLEIDIPPNACGAYRELQLGEQALRLSAITWILPNTPEPAWTLLLVLEAQPGSELATGTCLQVRDDIQPLVKQVLTNPENPYLYAQVGGTWNEQFWVTIGLTDGAIITLPPFAFNPAVSP